MASSQTHTTSHMSEYSEPQGTLVHSRNLSTISSATLHTSTTLHSQPYEPLLRPITPASEDYDIISHQSRPSERVLSLPRWSRSQSNVISRHSPVLDEKGYTVTERTPRNHVQLLRWSKRVLELIMAIWSIYSTARYLIAYTIYDSITGQVAAIVLGICAGLSFAFGACSNILSMAQTTLLINGFSVQALLTLRSLLYYLSSICFFGPSIANLAFFFVWGKTSDLELQERHRCKLDIDLVWSVPTSLCNHKTQARGLWIGLAAIRILLTLIIIISFHLIASSSHFMPPRRRLNPRHIKGKKSHVRLESEQTDVRRSTSHDSMGLPHLNRDDPIQQQTSDASLSSMSSPRNRLRNARSRSTTASGDAPSYNDTGFLPMNSHHHEVDPGMPGFVERFRSIIQQITRETEDGLAFAQSDAASSSHQVADSPPPKSSSELDLETASQEHDHDHDNFHQHYADEDEDDFYSAAAARELSVNDYHQPYPADEHIRMMNGYIRRMPTIESMGSREMRNSLGASSLDTTNRDRRPPTRTTRLSWASTDFSGSEPRSPSNSLSAQAELLVGMFGKSNASEVGELMMRGDTTVRMVESTGPTTVHDDVSEALGDYDSSTSGSKESKESTGSFHTASSGSTINSLKTALRDASATPFPLPPSLLPSHVQLVHPDP